MKFHESIGRALILLGAAATLNGCVSTGRVSDVEHERDSGPSRPVDLSHIPDAVPKRETRTIAGNKTPYTVLGKTYHVSMDIQEYNRDGIASWYGNKFHGRNTSNGEVYDMYAMTAAHKTLPIPSYVRVTNLGNNKQVVVRVNDRGPFHGDRIIDLSYAAASKLGFADYGTALVNVELINLDAPPKPVVLTASLAPVVTNTTRAPVTPVANRFVQVGAFSNLASAQSLHQRLVNLINFPVLIASANNLHKVRIGPIVGDIEIDHIRQLMAEHQLGEPIVVVE